MFVCMHGSMPSQDGITTCSRRARGRAASDSGSRYAEIGYFGHEVFVEQYVLGFEVTMNHTALTCVQKLHAFGDLWG